MDGKRKISKDKYVIAGFLTLLIFSLGLLLGFLVDNFRVQWAEKNTLEQETDLASLQLQYLYLSSLQETNESCAVLKVALDSSVKDLSESLDKFQQYKDNSKINEEEFEAIGRKYMLDNIRYWLFARKAKETCEIDLVTVLYFYSGKYCENCPDQGVLLSYYKRIFEEKLLVFPIDVDLQESESMIKILMDVYDVEKYPTIVIEDKRYEGVVEKTELGNLICGAFNNPAICEQ